MTKIEAFEDSAKIIKAIYWAYRESQEMGNDILNFYEVIDDDDIKLIVQLLRDNKVKEFSIPRGR